MFYIRADGNDKTGMGHIMRCITIAQALKAQGQEVTFLIADDAPAKILEEKGFPYHILFTYYDEMNVELPQLVTFLSSGTSVDASSDASAGASGRRVKNRILVDSYYVTRFYLENLRLLATVILLDDMKTEVYPCDILVNYNIYGKTLGYEEDYPDTTKLLLGSEYAPLREEFVTGMSEKDNNISGKNWNILVTTGGGDSCHMMLTFAQKLIQDFEMAKPSSQGDENIKMTREVQESDREKPEGSITYHMVCGPFCPDTGKLQQLAKEHDFLQIHENVTNMSDLMKMCNLAVSAAGSTLYELCAMGIPAVGFYFVENQRRNMEAFAAKTPIMNAGDFSQSPRQVLEFIQKEIGILMESPKLCQKISMVMQTIVDGQGARRLAKEMLT